MKLKQLSNRWLWFVLAVVAQFSVLFYVSITSDNIIREGTVLRFRMAGFDPHDMFRGDYIRIGLKDNTLRNPERYSDNELYVYFSTEKGYAEPKSIQNYCSKYELSLKANVVYRFDSTQAYISYPFVKMWMNQEESKKAEEYIAGALREGKDVYALIAINEGEGRLVDIEIGDKTLQNAINFEE